MGSASSTSTKNYAAKDGTNFVISYHAFVEHILLLRKVIHHPEMRKEGPLLDSVIQDYCQRMARGEMRTTDQQLKLPWEIEWIWHVHRLHPLTYLNDCSTQLSDGLVDKKTIRLTLNDVKKNKSKMTLLSMNNFSSIDLTSAVIRQNNFLNKFQKHFLYSYHLKRLNKSIFHDLVQDYVLFFKLARKNQIIVPTFDIDLIWRTHIRFPSNYHEFSKGLCGFILDYDDPVETYVLADAYQITADRWKQNYKSEYGKYIDRKHLQTFRYTSSSAMVADPVLVSNTTEGPSDSAFQDDNESSGVYTGTMWRGGGFGYDWTVSVEKNLFESDEFSY
jgi:hypothetical protein